MSTSLKILIVLVLASNIRVGEAQDFKSDQEYEKLKSHATPSTVYPDGNAGQLQLLIMCIDRGDIVTLDKLLYAAPDFANVDEGTSGCSPIFWASFRGNTNIMAILLKHGAKIRKKGTNWGISALHIAHDSETAEFLLRHGANIESVDVYGETPLMWAAKHGNVEVVKTLIKNGARLNRHDHAKWTALELAQFFGHTNVVELLADKGASPSRKTKKDSPDYVVAGSWLYGGTNDPFAEDVLVSGGHEAMNEHSTKSTH